MPTAMPATPPAANLPAGLPAKLAAAPGKIWPALLLLAGCAGTPLPTPSERLSHADLLAGAANWQRIEIPAGEFTLAAWLPARLARLAAPATAPAEATVTATAPASSFVSASASAPVVSASASVSGPAVFPSRLPASGNPPVADRTLTVYIEGDGLAWLTASRPSDDPTPRDPLALRLALAQESVTAGASAYLARPCQYVRDAAARRCRTADWTEARFAAPVIDASDRAIDALKARFGAGRLVLVGYSGGGAVAALVAARRHDVAGLITVAGNLDHLAWTRLHRIRALAGSLNAADSWQALAALPQVHFVGADDDNLPVAIANAYRARFPAQSPLQVRLVPGADHHCCWAQKWPALLATAGMPEAADVAGESRP